MNAPAFVDPCLCPLCGQVNRCAMETPATGQAQPCWCTRVHFSRELMQQLPDEALGKACICQSCAQQGGPPA